MADRRRRDKINEKKVDLKGRRLFENEHQRLDEKHYGLYEYKYRDQSGKRRTISSWRLVASDKVPAGKRDCVPLRDQERQIQKASSTGVDYYAAKNVTINDVFTRYFSTKENLKESSRVSYLYTYNHWVRDDFGKRPIGKVLNSDILNFYASLLQSGLQVSTLEAIHSILCPTFQQAVKDRIIPINPATRAMSDLRRSKKLKTRKRAALTEIQQKTFEDFLLTGGKKYERWSVLFLSLLWSGCRIGEGTGLTWNDIDFDQKVIHISHQLSYRPNTEGRCTFKITTTKTDAGVRDIPISDDLFNLLVREREFQSQTGSCKTQIDGYSGFIYSNRSDEVYSPTSVNRALKRIVKKCNAAEAEKAKKENRLPVVIPDISPHNLRHTFCTRLCEVEDNIAIIMSIMGHEDSHTTIQIYNDVQDAKKKRSFDSIRAKMRRMV